MRIDVPAIEGLRALILAGGPRLLAVGDLRDADLADLAWSGNPAHLRSVAAALHRAVQGLEDYLVVRGPAGQPVAKMRVDYTSEADTGVFSQLATMDPLQGLGIATMLIGIGEQRVRARGLASAALGVEENNPRARRLYERLGYPGSRPPACIVGIRRRRRPAPAVRNDPHDPAQAFVTRGPRAARPAGMLDGEVPGSARISARART